MYCADTCYKSSCECVSQHHKLARFGNPVGIPYTAAVTSASDRADSKNTMEHHSVTLEGFWLQLAAHLAARMDEVQAKKIAAHAKLEHSRYVATLSLDNCEAIAKRLNDSQAL